MNDQMKKTFFSTEKSVGKMIRKFFNLKPSDYLMLDIRHGHATVDGGGYYIGMNAHFAFTFDKFDMETFKRITESELPQLFFGDRAMFASIEDRDYYDSDKCIKANYYLKPEYA